MTRLRDAIEIWGTCPKYKRYAARWLWLRLVSADDNDKLVVYYNDAKKPVGFVTYAFLTNKEAETLEWYGPEAFSRDDGDQLWMMDMVANGGRADVIRIAKDIRKSLKQNYPHVKTVKALRHASRVGTFPNKGNWHETA